MGSDQPTVVITRPYADAANMVKVLESKGFSVLGAPMFQVFPVVGGDHLLQDINIIALTSANGARALAAATSRRDYRIYAVGAVTAEVARTSGFDTVMAAGGNVDLLARVIISSQVEEPVLHVGGRHQAGDLVSRLRSANIPAEKLTLYEAKAVSHLPEDVVALLEAGKLSWVTFFSPRTAELFLELIKACRLESGLKNCRAVALSVTVASVLKRAKWQEIRVAEEPFTEQIIDILTFEVT